MILPAAFLLLQVAQPNPSPPLEEGLRIIAVEQIGKPPYIPNEGRVYRIAGSGLGQVKPNDALLLKREGTAKDLGLLRVLTVYAEESAIARLEIHGETFPLKGDLVLSIAPSHVPVIIADRPILKHGLPYPLNPPIIPSAPRMGAAEAKLAGLPMQPRPFEDVVASLAEKHIPQSAAKALGLPKLIEQNPIYFLKGSVAISPKGIEKLKEWIKAWGIKDLKYFLAVPPNQLHLEQKTAVRLEALQKELLRLGIPSVEFRTAQANAPGPYDVIYVGIEG
jgi:hypothetical protein